MTAQGLLGQGFKKRPPEQESQNMTVGKGQRGQTVGWQDSHGKTRLDVQIMTGQVSWGGTMSRTTETGQI